jgi:adenylate kinase family enzyme
MGLPGAGKDVQSRLLADKLNCKVFSSGEHLRNLAKENSVFGRKVAKILDSGDLAPYWLSSFIVSEAFLLLDNNEAVIFDGIGRQESEARLFVDICTWLERDFRVIYLNVSEQTIVERINKRHVTEGRTDDDNIQDRLNKYNTHTLPALNFFRTTNKVIDIDGEPLPDVVATEVWQKVSAL